MPIPFAVAPIEQLHRTANTATHDPGKVMGLTLGCLDKRTGGKVRLDVQADHGFAIRSAAE
jgi:hypothetical protein